MRCLSLADALNEHGVVCIFVTSDLKCERLISNQGYECICINSRWDDYCDGADELCAIANRYGCDCVVTDSYYTNSKYFDAIHDYCRTVIISEDIPNGNLKNIDLFINYNIYVNEVDSEVFNYDTCLGTKYALLRKEFSRNKCGSGDCVLVLSGGTDPLNIASHMLKRLRRSLPDGTRIITVTSSMNMYIEDLRRVSERYNIELFVDVRDMLKVYKEAAVAVSAGGSTLYELCACGIPTVTFAYVDNQIKNVEGFHKAQIMPYAGYYPDDPQSVSDLVIEFILKTLKNNQFSADVSTKMRGICDGNGANRVAHRMMFF